MTLPNEAKVECTLAVTISDVRAFVAWVRKNKPNFHTESGLETQLLDAVAEIFLSQEEENIPGLSITGTATGFTDRIYKTRLQAAIESENARPKA